MQTARHVPFTHVTLEAFGTDEGHARLQPPQWLKSLLLMQVVPHRLNPGGQVMPQSPFAHVALPPVEAGQARPHAPQ